MKVLLVGQAGSIFFEHYTKHLKASRKDTNIDIFSIDKINGYFDLSSCDNVDINPWSNSSITKIKVLGRMIYSFLTIIAIIRFLQKGKKQYDIIHFKWLITPIVLLPFFILRKHSNKIVASFWGGEFTTQKVLYSSTLYNFFLKKFINQVDAIANSGDAVCDYMKKNFSKANSKLHIAKYGSSIAEILEEMVQNETKQENKKYFGVDDNQITISVGYSGKAIHQHLNILQILIDSTDFQKYRDKFTFIFPVSRSYNSSYVNQIRELLTQHKLKYKILEQQMGDFEVARLRMATDIMIQLSKFDGRSASIIECFLAGSIVISGSWLPYELFHKKGLHFYELDAIDEKLPDLLLKIGNNIDAELDKCKDNKNKWGFDTWEKVIPGWISVYEKVLTDKSELN